MPKYELNVRDYLRILRKRRAIIILSIIIVLVGTIFYLANQPVIYQSSATVKIEEQKTLSGLLTEWVVYTPADLMESETKLIKAYDIMRNTALKLGMINDKSTLEAVNNAVNVISGSVATERISSTNMIRIIATADTAKEAMDIANTVTEVYIEDNLLNKAKQVRRARQFIEDQLGALESRMKKTENNLRLFGDDSRVVKLAVPIEKKLVDLQFQLAEALQKYTEKYPTVIQLKEQIARLEGDIKGLSGREVEYARLMREADVNKKLYAMLREKLEEARISEAQKVSDISVVDPASLPSGPISTDKKLGLIIGVLMGVILGVALAFIVETLDTSISTIEDVESMVKLKVLGLIPPLGKKSNKNRNLFEQMKDRFFPSENKFLEEEEPIYLVAHFDPTSVAAEAYRNVQTNLRLDPSQKTLLITSSGPGEGKSTITSNLSVVMAQSGLRVLIISADLRRPKIDKVFGIKREPGLNEFISGSAGLKDVVNNIVDIIVGNMDFDDIRKTPGFDNINIITSGRLSYNPSEILKSKDIKELLEKVKSHYDIIIFDAPPVLPVTDSSILAPYVDAVVLVYEIGKTSREALIRTKIQLESVGAKISGVILNHTHPETEAIVSYPYYKYRYGYPIRKDVLASSNDTKLGGRMMAG